MVKTFIGNIHAFAVSEGKTFLQNLHELNCEPVGMARAK